MMRSFHLLKRKINDKYLLIHLRSERNPKKSDDEIVCVKKDKKEKIKLSIVLVDVMWNFSYHKVN